MTRKHFETVMQIPSCTGHEDMMIDFLLDWAKQHGVKAHKDSKGNVFMEKGSGKFRPALCNHIDTVHHNQLDLINSKTFKKIIWEGDTVKAENPITNKQTGLGMDDLGGCAIALAVIDRLPACKAAFFVEEENHLQGSSAANLTEWIKDVAFVISNDSPERNRGTQYSSGVQLYSDEFFEKYLKQTCAEHGLTKFNSEPYTDIKLVRSAKLPDGKHIECLNFGNGGYHPHRDTEYAKFNEVNEAEELVYALCTTIPTNVQHSSELKEITYTTSSSLNNYFSDYYRQRGSSAWNWQSNWQSQKSSSILEKQYQYTWTFTDSYITADEKIKKFVKLVNDNYKTLTVKQKNKTVIVTGEYIEIKKSYMDAYNVDNDKHVLTWVQFTKDEPTGNDIFNKAIKEIKVQPITNQKYKDNDECSLLLDFGNDSTAEDDIIIFENILAEENLEIEIDDALHNSIFVIGKFKDLKTVFVEYVNFYESADFNDWNSLENSIRGTEDFWNNISLIDDPDSKFEIEDDYIDVDSSFVDNDDDADDDESSFMDWLKNRK